MKPGFRNVDLTDWRAGASVQATIPAGQLLLSGGWTAPSGKRVLVIVRPEVDTSGEKPTTTPCCGMASVIS